MYSTKRYSIISETDKKIYRPYTLKFHTLNSMINFNAQYALFDFNGVISDPSSLVYEGFFTEQRVANQLPNDFVPTQ